MSFSLGNALLRHGLLAAVIALLLNAPVVQGADQTFVGVLAIAIDKDVAQKIGLPDDVRTKLQDLVSQREDEALELAKEIKELTPAERATKLAPFVAESEKQGLALLSDEQKTKLEQVRIGKVGLETLGEPAIAKKLALTDTQKSEIAKALEKRASEIIANGESKRSVTISFHERQLAKLLTPEQKAQWDALAGIQPGEKPSAEASPMERGGPGVAETPRDRGRESGREGSRTDSTKPAEPKVENIVRSTIKPSANGKVKFNFRYTPWKDVLDFFAGTADLSLDAVSFPPGTCNYTDTKEYTPAEGIDILNAMLQSRGFMLVQRERLLILVNIEESPLVGPLVPQVLPSELDKYGDFSILGCLFHLKKYAPEDAEADLKKFIGPQGSLLVMPKAKAIFVRENAGNLRTIRRLIEGVENPDENQDDGFVEVTLKNVLVEEVLPSIRELMGMPVDRNALPDGSLRFAVDSFASRLLATGKPEKITKLKEVVKLLDRASTTEGASPTIIETPQLVVYPITSADPASVLKVLQTLLADLPDVRMELDPKTGNLIVLARPSQHATVKATLQEMQQNPSEFEVFTLRRLDVQLAILSINKLFNAGEGGDPKAPKVDGDPTTRQLIVRGSAGQIAQIKGLLEKMGESETSPLATGTEDRGTVRYIDASSGPAKRALAQVEAVWGTMRENRIRVVTPVNSEAARPNERTVAPSERTVTPSERTIVPDPVDEFIEQYVPLNPGVKKPMETPKPAPAPMKKPVPAEGKSTYNGPRRLPLHLATYRQAPAEAAAESEAAPATEVPPQRQPAAPAATDTKPDAEKKPGTDKKPEKKPSKPGAEIIVTFGPTGILLASEDTEALDEFEKLFRSLLDRAATSAGSEFTVFYLKYAKAEIAASLLSEMIGASAGTGAEASGGGGGGLMGSMMNAALGDSGGGLLGSLFGLDGGGGGGGASAPAIATSGKVTVIPDPRLNALVVQAGQSDLDLVEQLLKVIDQEYGPEPVQLQPKPRMIPVKYVTADEVAATVRELYAARIAGGAGAQQRQQPSPEEFVRALRGGGGGRGGAGQQKQRGEEVKMTIGVDKRSNSLVVSAPDPLFKEVEMLVAQIDKAGTDAAETQVVVTLKKTSPEVVAKGLQSLLGANAKTTITPASSPQAQSGAVQGSGQGRPGGGQGGPGQGQPGAFGAGGQNPFQQLLQQSLQQGMGGGRGGAGGGRGGAGGGRGGAGGGFGGAGAGGGRGGR